MSYIIYQIIDPRNRDIFYIGRTNNLARRIEEHLDGSHGGAGYKITAIKRARKVPLFAILKRCKTLAQAKRSETFWIETYRSQGVPIVNKENPYAQGPPRSGHPWTEEEDRELQDGIACKIPLSKIAFAHKRSTGAIRKRLKYLQGDSGP